MHQLSLFRQIEEQALGRGAYGRLLMALHDFHATVGHALGQSRFASASNAAARTALIRSDLEFLGRDCPLAGRRWSLDGEAELLGALYVAEGSMLGGKIIARQLDHLFYGDDGRRFFRGSPGDARPWRTVLELIAGADGDPAMIGSMVAGAERTFALFELCVEDHS